MADIRDPIAWCREMLKESQFYHGSPHEIKTLEPRNLTGDAGGEDLIFASPSRAFALAFAGGGWRDRDLSQSVEGKRGERKVHLRELRPGVFDEFFGQPGYMYTVPEEPFGPWDRGLGPRHELVSRNPVDPSATETIENVLEELQKDPETVLHPYDIADPETEKTVRRRVKLMLDKYDHGEKNKNKKSYKSWMLGKAPDEMKDLWEKIEKEEREKTAAQAQLPSQDEIYKDVVSRLPASVASRMMHASGGLPDVRGVSDVDAAILVRNHSNLLHMMPPGTKPEDKGTHTIYSVPGYAREVNIYATPDKTRPLRSVTHRNNEKLLEEKFPQLTAVAARVKADGLSTEKAWARVLDLPGDPYEAMLDTRQVLSAAMEKSASLGIRMSKEASMSKKGQYGSGSGKSGVGGVQPVQGVEPVEGVGGVDAGGMETGGRKQQQKQELDAWGRWINDRNPQDFKFLLDSYTPFMNYMGQRHLQAAKTGGTLPVSTIKADMIQSFHRAMETYEPDKGQLNTHIGNHLRHTGRFVRTYSNIGKMPDPRSRMVWQYKDRETVLTERLGRPPSSVEMADDLGMSQKDVELLRTEIRKDIIVDPTTSGLGSIAPESSKAMEQLNFLHMELAPDQQNILEYTYGMHGRQAVDNNEELAQILGISPQKVRAIKRQIARRYEKRYR